MSRYVSIDDLMTVRPSLLSAMLMRAGWRELQGKPGVFRVLESPSAETDVAIPLNREYRDYRLRLDEALTGAEEALGRRARSFMLQLLAGPMDELFFREDVPTLYGSIPWRDGQHLHETARDVCRAAAKSWEQRLPYFGQKAVGSANRFMKQVRMGQTEVGSYVVTALVPLDERESRGGERPLFEDEDLNLAQLEGGFLRGVTANLMHAAEAAIYAAGEFDRTESFEAFADVVDYGVSADLLTALSSLLTGDGGQEAEIQAQWSPLVGEPRHIANSVEVRPEHLSAFAQAIQKFKEGSELPTVTVTGEVTALDRPRFGQAGTTTMNVLTGVPASRIRVRLSRDQYDAAIEAHRIGDVLRVTGELSRVGNYYWLHNAREIQVVQGQLPFENGQGV